MNIEKVTFAGEVGEAVASGCQRWMGTGCVGKAEGGDYKMQEMAPGLMHNSFLFTVMGSSFKDSFLRRRQIRPSAGQRWRG